MNLDNFIKEMEQGSKVCEQELSNDEPPQFGLSMVIMELVSGLAQALKTENTEIIKLFPCKCRRSQIRTPSVPDPKPFIIKCHRCKLLTERETNE